MRKFFSVALAGYHEGQAQWGVRPPSCLAGANLDVCGRRHLLQGGGCRIINPPAETPTGYSWRTIWLFPIMGTPTDTTRRYSPVRLNRLQGTPTIFVCAQVQVVRGDQLLGI